MSTRNDLPGEGKLHLPSPRSPAELDGRIINAARERAPRPRSQRHPWWMAGAATACVLVVAVLLVKPQQPAPQFESKLSSAPEASKNRALKHARDDSSAGSIQKLELRRYPEKDSQTGMEMGLSMQSPSPAAEAAALEPNKASAVPTDSELYQRLEMLADLIKEGKEEIAIEAYEKLKREYTDDSLPKTLDEALIEHQLKNIR